MKLNVTQTNALADELCSRIRELIPDVTLSDEKIRLYDEFEARYMELENEANRLSIRRRNLVNDFNIEHGTRISLPYVHNVVYIDRGKNFENMTEKIQHPKPDVNVIRQQLIVRGIFGDQQDMTEYMNALTKQYTEL